MLYNVGGVLYSGANYCRSQSTPWTRRCSARQQRLRRHPLPASPIVPRSRRPSQARPLAPTLRRTAGTAPRPRHSCKGQTVKTRQQKQEDNLSTFYTSLSRNGERVARDDTLELVSDYYRIRQTKKTRKRCSRLARGSERGGARDVGGGGGLSDGFETLKLNDLLSNVKRREIKLDRAGSESPRTSDSKPAFGIRVYAYVVQIFAICGMNATAICPKFRNENRHHARLYFEILFRIYGTKQYGTKQSLK